MKRKICSVHRRVVCPCRKGSCNGNHILTEDDVMSIKYLLNDTTQREISKIYRVHVTVISTIKTGRSWRHVK